MKVEIQQQEWIIFNEATKINIEIEDLVFEYLENNK